MYRTLIVSLLAAAGVAGGIFAFASPGQAPTPPHQEQAGLPGITAKDPFPNGCVSCHINTPDGQDHRISTGLAAIKGHPKLSVVAAVPTDCAKCHKAGTKMEGLSTLLHKAHFQKLENSEFVKLFQGQCLTCHSLDSKTGKIGVKTGPKNW